jgi:hypothetical protein
VGLDEGDCDLATWLCLSKGDTVNTSVWTSEGAGGPSLTWKVTTGGGLCVYLLSATTSEGRPGWPSSPILTQICAADIAKGPARSDFEDVVSDEGRKCGVVIQEDAIEYALYRIRCVLGGPWNIGEKL